MSRRNRAPVREILPDPKFGSLVLAKFINSVMKSGKKSVAERIVYNALATVKENSNTVVKQNEEKLSKLSASETLKQADVGLSVFYLAIENLKPIVEVRSRRVGGATYQIPVPVAPNRAAALAYRWLVNYAKKRKEDTMDQRLANEILEAAGNRGEAIKFRENIYRMAEANKAFAHYRF